MKYTLAFLLLALSSALHAADAATDRPNIVFLLSDDQTIGAVGCYGNKDVITPYLDKLASIPEALTTTKANKQ